MNKTQLIEEVAKVTCGKKEAEMAVGAALAAIQNALKKGDAVTLVGFGTFGSVRGELVKAGIPTRVKPLK